MPQGCRVSSTVLIQRRETYAEEADEPREAVTDDAGEEGVVGENDAAILATSAKALSLEEVKGETVTENVVAGIGVNLVVQLGDEFGDVLAIVTLLLNGSGHREGAGEREEDGEDGEGSHCG